MKIKLSDASRRLSVPYHVLFNAVAANRIPAERDASGSRWQIDEANLPEIAQVLGWPAARRRMDGPQQKKSVTDEETANNSIARR